MNTARTAFSVWPIACLLAGQPAPVLPRPVQPMPGSVATLGSG